MARFGDEKWWRKLTIIKIKPLKTKKFDGQKTPLGNVGWRISFPIHLTKRYKSRWRVEWGKKQQLFSDFLGGGLGSSKSWQLSGSGDGRGDLDPTHTLTNNAPETEGHTSMESYGNEYFARWFTFEVFELDKRYCSRTSSAAHHRQAAHYIGLGKAKRKQTRQCKKDIKLLQSTTVTSGILIYECI